MQTFNHPLVPFKFPVIILQYETFHVAELLRATVSQGRMSCANGTVQSYHVACLCG